MTFSPLADMSRRIPDGGRSNARTSKISGVGIHHNAGINSYPMATDPRYEVSANYWITNDGALIPNIDESRRAFTSGAPGYPAGRAADMRNITFEVSNSATGDDWPVSDAAVQTLIEAIADIYKRYNLGPVKRGAGRGVGVHRDWVPTACPGPYLMSKLDYIIEEAEKLRSGAKPAPAPKPTPGSGLPAAGVAMLKGARLGDHLSIRDWWTYSDAALTKKIATVTGTFEIVGIDYKARPGDEPSLRIKDAGNTRRWIHVSAVDGKSDKALTRFGSAGTPARKPAPARKTDAELAAEVWAGKHGTGAARIKSLGTRYAAVQALVNKGVGRGGSSSSVRKSNAQVAREIVHGVNGRNPWGNDPGRSQKLRAAGYDPKAIQREVNKLL